jgi:hypothetical protein
VTDRAQQTILPVKSTVIDNSIDRIHRPRLNPDELKPKRGIEKPPAHMTSEVRGCCGN